MNDDADYVQSPSNRSGVLPDKRIVKKRLSYGKFWLTVIATFSAGVVVGGLFL